MTARKSQRGHLWDMLRTVEDRQDRPSAGASRARPALTRRHAMGNLLAALARDPLKTAPGRERKNHSTIKAELIDEHGPTCKSCDVAMPGDSLIHLHHVVPVSDGGPDTRENCLLLCPNCHAIAHWQYRKIRKDDRPTTPEQLIALLAAA